MKGRELTMQSPLPDSACALITSVLLQPVVQRKKEDTKKKNALGITVAKKVRIQIIPYGEC